MLRIEVDINLREGDRTIVIPAGSVSDKALKVGTRVILHEPGMECEGILRRGTTWPWVADIVEETIKEVPSDY